MPNPETDSIVVADEQNTATVNALREASRIFDGLGRPAQAVVCNDMANNLVRYGGFASERQAAYARDLISMAAQQREPNRLGFGTRTVVVAPATPAITLPNLARLFVPGGLARLTWRGWRFGAARDRVTTWISNGGLAVARMSSDGTVRPTRRGQGTNFEPLQLLDSDPVAQMQAEGLASGRCCVCTRELTDPESIRLGIGPVCRGRVGGLLEYRLGTGRSTEVVEAAGVAAIMAEAAINNVTRRERGARVAHHLQAIRPAFPGNDNSRTVLELLLAVLKERWEHEHTTLPDNRQAAISEELANAARCLEANNLEETRRCLDAAKSYFPATEGM